MTAARRRRRMRLLWTAAIVVSMLLVGGWVGARTLFPMHKEWATGRSDITGITCLHCHRRIEPPRTRGAAGSTPYLSPMSLDVSPDGSTLWVAASGASRVLAVDLETRAIRSAEIPGGVHDVAVFPGGDRLAVANRDGNRVLLLDTVALEVRAALPAEEPLGVAIASGGGRVWVANAAGDDLTVIDTADETTRARVVTGNMPCGVAVSESGGVAAVIGHLAWPVTPRVVPASELTLVSLDNGRVLDRRELTSAHLGESVALSSDGSFALAPVVRVRNLLPTTQVARGAVMSSALVYAETRPGGRTVQLPLDEVNAYFGDPSGVALTPDDRLAFVAHGGARVVTVVDVEALREWVGSREPAALEAAADDLGLSSSYVVARIPTLDNPRGVALSPSGDRLYVAERLADTVAVIDTTELRVVDRIDLGGPREATVLRRGERVFHDATGTFQGQFSCRSCHPEGHTDGLIWDFEIDGLGRHLLETRSLRAIGDTAPFKWSGKNPDLATQCGPRFSRVLMRSDPFPPDRLADLVAFIESIPLAPRAMPAGFEDAIERGRELFERTHTATGKEIPKANRCDTCHRGTLFTDRLKADVGTGGKFDTPHLTGIGSSPPYLHDGRSLTLEEIWTVHSPDDTHGVTSDMTKVQLNDLVIYLRSL